MAVLKLIQGDSDSEVYRLPQSIKGYSWWLVVDSRELSDEIIVENVMKNGTVKTRVANCHPVISADVKLASELGVKPGALVCGVRYWS
jgi:hypothetical protein